MDIYAQIAVQIVSAQETIIGPVAIEQAEQIPNLKLDWKKRTAQVDGSNKAKVIDDLVGVYQRLFGQISVEVSKESTSSLTTQLSPQQLPESLK